MMQSFCASVLKNHAAPICLGFCPGSRVTAPNHQRKPARLTKPFSLTSFFTVCKPCNMTQNLGEKRNRQTNKQKHLLNLRSPSLTWNIQIYYNCAGNLTTTKNIPTHCGGLLKEKKKKKNLNDLKILNIHYLQTHGSLLLGLVWASIGKRRWWYPTCDVGTAQSPSITHAEYSPVNKPVHSSIRTPLKATVTWLSFFFLLCFFTFFFF